MVLQGTMLDPVDGKIRPLTEIAGEYAATFGDIYIEAATRSLSPGSWLALSILTPAESRPDVLSLFEGKQLSLEPSPHRNLTMKF